MKSNQAYASIPTVLPAAERSEAERSEAERSGAAGKTVADSGTFPRPDPQVVAKAKRRIFKAEYKQRILAEADKAKERSGALGTLLRRESLYSSHLVSWRKERAAGILQALTPQKRGRKSPRHPCDEENQQLRRENQYLTKSCAKPRLSLRFKKKWRRCWGVRSWRRTGRKNPDGRRHRTRSGGGYPSRLRRPRRPQVVVLPAAATPP